jgi:hypothetical protein
MVQLIESESDRKAYVCRIVKYSIILLFTTAGSYSLESNSKINEYCFLFFFNEKDNISLLAGNYGINNDLTLSVDDPINDTEIFEVRNRPFFYQMIRGSNETELNWRIILACHYFIILAALLVWQHKKRSLRRLLGLSIFFLAILICMADIMQTNTMSGSAKISLSEALGNSKASSPVNIVFTNAHREISLKFLELNVNNQNIVDMYKITSIAKSLDSLVISGAMTTLPCFIFIPGIYVVKKVKSHGISFEYLLLYFDEFQGFFEQFPHLNAVDFSGAYTVIKSRPNVDMKLHLFLTKNNREHAQGKMSNIFYPTKNDTFNRVKYWIIFNLVTSFLTVFSFL